jgi:hypothetical protein
MDVGLGRFLEMFEERFGRRATTCLLAFIAVGIVAFFLPIIWGNLIKPTYDFSAQVAQGAAQIRLPNVGFIGAVIYVLRVGFAIAMTFIVTLLFFLAVNVVASLITARVYKRSFGEIFLNRPKKPS